MNQHPFHAEATVSTVVDLVGLHAGTMADEVLYRFLKPRQSSEQVEGQSEWFDTQTISYEELNQTAQRIAVWLREQVSPGDRVILAFPPGCEYLKAYFGCLYAGVIAVPAYPPRRNQRDQRLHAIIADADVRLALTSADLLESVKETMAGAEQVRWHSSESIESAGIAASDWVDPAIDSSTLAFLQYTSGSTGTPKGVMVTHGNLIHNQTLIQGSFRSTQQCPLTGWLPLHHDMGLIGNALHPLYLGSSLTFMSPIDFLQKPARWLQAISQFGGVVSGGPNFAYRLCADEVDDSDLDGVDLSGWKVAFNGAEPIDADVLDRFAKRFEPYGFSHDRFCPCYGMAETTLLVSSSVRGEPVRLAKYGDDSDKSGSRWVGCGVVREDMGVRIVDEQTLHELPLGQTGEIWLSGPSVAAGYWKRPEQTQETFQATLKGSIQNSAKHYLRTGDLGWIDPKDGELYVTGRCKDLLIVRGVNHYPQDIERTSESAHDASAIGGCAAFSVTRDGEECLVIAQEIRRAARRTVNADEMVDAIRDAVVDQHQLAPISILLLRPGSLPKTTSGKVQRSEARRQYLEDEFRVEHRWDLHHQAKNHQETNDVELTRARIQQPGQLSESANELAQWLINEVANRIKLPADSIDTNEPLSRYGLDSAGAVRLAGALSQHLGREIPPTLAYEYPTINVLASFLSGDEVHARTTRRSGPKSSKNNQAIAVVGIGCRFPMADSPKAFYDILCSGQDAIRDSAELTRFQTGKQISLEEAYRRGGYLDVVDQFDAGFFGISPREADSIDPQHRLLLETTHEAFEDAGIPITDMRGESVGVFVGSSHQDYLRLSNANSVTAYSASGNSMAMAAGRISYTFDFRGPSLTIDTACSSSLVATHQAMRAIRSGECDYAIASGVNLILSGEATESFAKAGMLSTTGVCSAFDDKANGFVRGEGVASVLLRPLDDAIADGNPIYCVLKGSAINQDGRTNGLTAPSRAAQAALIQDALSDAGIKASDIHYIEAHGTGTSLGDPIEIRAIREAIIDNSSATTTKINVGSVKSNIGHLESAAGIAGLIKVALSMHHGQLPPQIHFDQPNSNIPWDESITIATEPVPWDRIEDQPRIAGVSSFGFSGTNAHVLVEQVPVEQVPVSASHAPKSSEKESRPGDPLVTSAKSEASLEEQITQIQSIVLDVDHTSLAYGLAVGRSHHRHRAVRIGSSDEAQWTRGIAKRNPQVDLYFSGQGGVHPGWGRSLYESNATFAKHFDQAAASYQQITGDDLKLRVWGDASAWANVLIQPAIYSVQVATAQFWQSVGVQVHRVVGHSLGEYAAASIAGVFDFETGLELVARRGELAGQIQQRGGMLAVFASEADLTTALSDSDEAWDLAVVNGPRQTLIAALPDSLERLAETLKGKGLTSRMMSTTHGFHSRLIEPMLDEFEAFAATITMASPTGSMVSSQSGAIVTEEVAKPAYWRGNLRNAVRFDLALKTLTGSDESMGLEIGAGSTLSALARSSKLGLVVLPGMIDHPETGSNHGETLAKLYLHGADLHWRLALGQATPLVSLPTYPFDRSRHWFDSETDSPQPLANVSTSIQTTVSNHTSPGQRLDLASDDIIYQTALSSDSGFADHRVAGAVVFPAAGIIWWAYQSALGDANDSLTSIALADLRIDRSLVLESEAPKSSQLVLSRIDETNRIGRWLIRDESGWRRHASWKTQFTEPGDSLGVMPLDAVRCGHLQPQSVSTHYQQLEEAGLQYGPSYRGLELLRASGKWAEGMVAAPASGGSDVIGMLDSALQVIAATGHHWGTRTWVPVGAKRIEFTDKFSIELNSRFRVQAKLRQWDGDVATADVWIGQEDSESVSIRIVGLKLQATTSTDTQSCLFQEVYAPAIRLREPAGQTPTDFSATDWYSQMPQSEHCALSISDSLEAVAGRWVGDILSELGVRWESSESFTTEQLADRAAVVPAHHRLLNRLLEIASEEGWLQKSSDIGAATRWVVQNSPQSSVAEVPRIKGQDEFVLLDRCAAATARIMQTGDDPLPLLFPRDGQVTVANVYRDSVGGRRLNHLAAMAVQQIVSELPPGQAIRVLEIGAGTGSTTTSVLPHLPAHRCRYDFTDIAPGFFAAAKENFKEFKFVNYQVLNVEKDPTDQGFESRLQTYDLVIAANVLHATADMSTTIDHIARLLSPQGQLLVLEGTRPARWLDLTFGLTSGWWRFTDSDSRDHYPLLTCERWQSLLVDRGFEQPHFADPVSDDAGAPSHLIASHRQSAVKLTDTAKPTDEATQRLGVISFGSGDLKQEVLQNLQEKHSDSFTSIDHINVNLSSDGPSDAISEQITLQVQSICERSRPSHWVLMLDFDDGQFDSPGDDLLVASQCVLDAIQTIEHWCESTARDHSMSADQSNVMVDWVTCSSTTPIDKRTLVTEGLRGFWRTVTLEHPQWRCRSIDLIDDLPTSELVAMLADEIRVVALDRSEVRLSRQGREVRELAAFESSPQISSTTGRELAIRQRGSLDGLEVASRRRRQPDADEVEIRIQFAGLNFRDVLNVLGSYPGNPPLGAECVGVVSAIGERVTDFAIGDRVVAITAETFADFVTLPTSLICSVPESIDAVGLASLPVAFLTASESLESTAKLKAGDSVLIHSAAGGVGMAAVQLAQHVGAEVFATASQSKHEVLSDLGVKNIYDSRSLGYAEEILKATNNRGVDVVLNSLGEDFVEENLRSIAVDGRYVDIALSNDALTQRIKSIQPDVRYTTLDLSQTLALHTDSIRSRLEDLLDRMQSGQVRPLPSRTFGLGEAANAFAWMQEGVNIGKPLIQCDDLVEEDLVEEDLVEEDLVEEDPVEEDPDEEAPGEPVALSSSQPGVHLISGGLGGLGLLTSDYLLRQGVKDIVLLTRREPTDREAMILDDWNETGARVRVQMLEIDQLDSLQSALQDIRDQGVPITAVYHLAGVLQDSIVSEQSAALFKTVLDPKAKGGWNLHQATLDDPIEQFVLFSSMSGWLGSPGQANHATANAFLDALAEFRRRQKLPAISIGWGPWARVGSAAKRERLGKGDLAGIGMLMPDEGGELLQQILQASAYLEAGQSGAVPAKLAAGRLIVERLPEHLKGDPLFARITEKIESFESTGSEKPEWIRDFPEYPKERQFEEVMNHLRESIAGALSMSSPEAIPVDSPLFDLGMDSLTSLELVNHLQSTLGVRMSTVELFNFPDVRSLAGRLVDLVLTKTTVHPIDTKQTLHQCPETSAFDAIQVENDLPSDSHAIQTDAVGDATNGNEVSDLLREIGDLTDQFENWGNE